MMTSLCSDAAGAKPTTVDAVDVQGTLTTTSGNRLKMLVSLALLTVGTSGLVHHARHHYRSRSNHGYWANATESDEPPNTIVPCSVDLPQLPEAAGVAGIDATMIHREEHGCCGDEICALGEDSVNCASDCPEGTTGQLVWQEQGPHHDHHRDQDNDGDHSHDGDHDEQDAESPRKSDGSRDRRGHTKSHDKGDRHSLGKTLAFAALLACGLGLLFSIRQNWVAIARDFYTFLCPSCGNAARTTVTQPVPPGEATTHELHLNAIAVGPQGGEKIHVGAASTV